jgi:ClpP class serine protease
MTQPLANPANPHAASRWDITTYGGLAIVPISGVVYSGKTWGCSIPEALFALAGSPATQTVLLDLNCHGGELDGFDDIVRGIDVLRAAGKRVVAIAHDQAYSLGCFIGMLCDEFVATPTAMVGMLGIVRSIVDQSRYAAEQGLQEWVSTTDPTRKTGTLSPIPDGLKANITAIDAQTWMTISGQLAAARGIDAESLRAMGAEIMLPGTAIAAGIVDRVTSYDVLVGELIQEQAASTLPGTMSSRLANTTGRAAAQAMGQPNPHSRLSLETIMHTRSVIGSIGRSLGLVAAAGTVPSPMANAAALSTAQRGTAPANTGTPKASSDDAAKEMTEEQLEQKYPEAMKKIKAKAAAEAAKAAMEAAPKEEEKTEAKAAEKDKTTATAATIGELKAAFPDDGAYCFACLEQGLDMQAALLGKVKAQAAQIESLQSGRAKSAGTPAASGSAPAIPSSASLAGKAQAGGETGQTPADFESALQIEMDAMRTRGVTVSKTTAMAIVGRKHPELYASHFKIQGR